MENEKIGNITLDYTHYCGQDLYCDGEVEQELLDVAKNCSAAEYARVIEEKANWPFLYHLSPLRGNIVEWLPMDKNTKVLEVGSGCGAITGTLAKKAGCVECVDLSRQRSLINAYRHEYSDNVTIHVGNFSDIEPDLPNDYDVICLIGVFEYGQAYIGGDKPFETFLNILKSHLRKDGYLVIAIENRMGLKYFAGCREDHSGKLFSGIEGYPGENPAITFTQRGLLEIAKTCGFAENECHMYYPYPDYKFMNTLFSPERLPQEGELKDNKRNFDRSRLLLFDEKLAFENILKEGEFPLFSNSYVMILGKKPEIIYARYSNDRDDSKAIVTEMRDGKIVKRALGDDGASHIKNMASNYELLAKRYEGSKLEICPCELSADGKSVIFPFVKGRRLEELMDECVFAGNIERFKELFLEYVEKISYGEDKQISDLDMIFSNILVDGDKWTVIDYEWVTTDHKFAKEIAFRAMYCYLLEDERRNCLDAGQLLTDIGITNEDSENYRRDEIFFQKTVTNGHKSLAELGESIGNEIVDITGGGNAVASSGSGKLKVYFYLGKGFNEKDTAYPDRNEGVYEIALPDKTRAVRLDPCENSCVIAIKKLSFDGEAVDFGSKDFYANGERIGAGGVFAFKTDDPGFTLKLGSVDVKPGSLIKADFEICSLPEGICEFLPEPVAPGGILSKLKGKLRK